METRLVLLSFLCTGIAFCFGSNKWSYDGKSGPKYWHELFPEACGGKAQSPINLKAEQTLFDPKLREFAIWYDPPKPSSEMLIKNTGHTVQVDLKGEFFVSNGGLSNVFRAVQFHFHWGHKSHHGSEHLFDGDASPLEMHLVTYNSDNYNDINQAATQSDGLAVLGVLFTVSEEDNPEFDAIVRSLKFIKNPHNEGLRIKLPLLSLRNLLPNDIRRYYRYKGSLTTPGCFESVTWTVFHDKQTISKRQMAEFRKLLQYRRLLKQQKEHEHSRHRRSLSDEEKKEEHEAKKVLDELGIRGNKLEEASLANEINEKKTKEHQEASPSDNGGTHSVVDNATKEHGDEKPREKVDDNSYAQDVLVNNFRPVQPINERIIYRSFELREVFYSEFRRGQTMTVDMQRSEDGGGASGLGISSTVLIASLLCLVIREMAGRM